jgi:hypothetical protein
MYSSPPPQPPTMSGTAHTPNRRTCDICQSILHQRSHQRCSKAGHAEAPVKVNFFTKHDRPAHMFCKLCHSERLASVAGGAQTTDYGPFEEDGAHVKIVCPNCLADLKDPSASAARDEQTEDVHADTRVGVPGDSSSDVKSMLPGILRVLEEVRQGQRELHNRQIETRGVLDLLRHEFDDWGRRRSSR